MRRSRFIWALLLSTLCVVAGLGMSKAYGAFGSGSNTLHVVAPDASWAKELESSDVSFDVYRIATAERDESFETYHYTLEGAFDDEAMAAFLDSGDWGELSAQAFDEVVTKDVKSVAHGDSIRDGAGVVSGLPDGIYLVLAHGSDGLTSPARSDLHEFSFTPSIVTMPIRFDGDGVASSGGTGDWLDETDVVLKAKVGPAYGDLRIEKEVENFSGEPATFVYHVSGTMGEADGSISGTIDYDNYVAITYDGTQESSYAVLPHIPAGMRLTVTEVYEGARYMVEGDDAVRTAPVVASHVVEAGRGETVVAHFENRRTSSVVMGHGIENRFVYDPTDEDSSESGWVWTRSPKEAS